MAAGCQPISATPMSVTCWRPSDNRFWIAWIWLAGACGRILPRTWRRAQKSITKNRGARPCRFRRSEEHTSELQSLAYLVCRLLLEKKKYKKIKHIINTNYIYIL